MRTIDQILIAALVATGIAAPALAQTAPIRVVKTDDLNLASMSGTHMLNLRISSAVRAVCAPEIQSTLMAGSDERKCRTQATAAAMTRVAAILSDHAIQLASR